MRRFFVYCPIDRLYRLIDFACEHVRLREPMQINTYRVAVSGCERLCHALANQFNALVYVAEPGTSAAKGNSGERSKVRKFMLIAELQRTGGRIQSLLRLS